MKTIKFLVDYKVKAAKGAEYKAGDYVEFPSASARHFIKRGVAVYEEKPKKSVKASADNRRIKPDSENQPETADDPKHIGGGTYELPDGTRVKGKEEADARMSKMIVGKTVPEPDRAAIAKRTFSDG